MENKEKYDELHLLLVNTIATFLHDNNLSEVDSVYFKVDGLDQSIKDKEWHPSTDSSIVLYKYDYDIEDRTIIYEGY